MNLIMSQLNNMSFNCSVIFAPKYKFMRRISLILLALIMIGQVSSARGYKSEPACPKVYLGVSTGLENPAGLVGFNMDVPVTGQFSLGAGLGLSTWGYKTYGEARFYFNPCNRGWAIGTGISYNTGLKDFTTKLPTTAGDRDVLLDLNPTTNAFVSGYRFWDLGRRGNRFYLQVGYSIRLTEDYYKNKSAYTLTNDGTSVLQILAPGGLMCAVGFSFGLGK
jgi:hypothetical protein